RREQGADDRVAQVRPPLVASVRRRACRRHGHVRDDFYAPLGYRDTCILCGSPTTLTIRSLPDAVVSTSARANAGVRPPPARRSLTFATAATPASPPRRRRA